MEPTLIVTCGVLWDGTAAHPIDDGVVVISRDRFTAAGARTKVPLPVGSAVQTLAFPGSTVLPGLIDTHVHLIWPGDGTLAHQYTPAASDAELLLTAIRNARLALGAGVTTLRDVGSRGRIVLELRDAIARESMLGPRIITSGAPITISGGHMHYLGGEADTASDIRRVARRLWRDGVDFFKMVLNGGGTPRTHPWIPSYNPAEIDVAVEEARAHETYVVVHANAHEAIQRAVSRGVTAIEHCTFLRGPKDVVFEPRLVESMASRRVIVGHTLQAGYLSLKRACGQWASLTIAEREYWDTRRRIFEAQSSNSKRLVEMGVRLAASTDAGWSLNPFGEYWRAMDLLVQAGVSPIQALRTGTVTAAEALGLDAQLGTITPGKVADLVVVDGNPTVEITDLRRVRAVVKSGCVAVHDGKFVA